MSERFWLVTERARGEQRKIEVYADDIDDEEALRRCYPEEAVDYEIYMEQNPDLFDTFQEWLQDNGSDDILLVNLGPAAPSPYHSL